METDSDDDSVTCDSTDDNYMDLRISLHLPNECAMSLSNSTLTTSKGEDLCDLFNSNNVSSVHAAVLENSMDMLDASLRQPHADVNYKDDEGKTPLMKSVGMYRSNSFIMRLLEAGSDPNISDKYMETPLHVAVTRPTIDVAHELIKRGADVNAQAKNLRTPLHQAVDYGNLDAVCLLLYYGTDVNVLSKNNTTPLMNALSYGDVNVSELLVSYYDMDDCLCKIDQGYPTLYFAMQRRSPLAIKLVEMGADVNYITPHGENLLVFSLFYSDASLFELMWNRFDYDIILNSKTPFLASYLKNCCFAAGDWVKCLYSVLKSPVAFDLLEHYYDNFWHQGTVESSFWQELLRSLFRENVRQSDRLTIIHIVLSLGAEPNIYDLIKAYELYGFNEELELFIYCTNYSRFAYKSAEFKFLLIPFILGLEDDFHINSVQVACRFNNYPSISVESLADREHAWLGFFTRSCYRHLFKKLPTWWLSRRPEIEEKLQHVPEMPSLLELSRSPARKMVRRACKVTTPYRFYDAVKSLNLPQCIKDIVCFKRPVYKV